MTEKHKDFNHFYELFKTIIPKTAGKNQTMGMTIAFYSGAASVFNDLDEVANMSEDAACEKLQTLRTHITKTLLLLNNEIQAEGTYNDTIN